MNINTSHLPREIADCLHDLENDIDIQIEIPKGASGFVFLGEHRILERRVAIKFYYSGADGQNNEVRLLSGLDVPNILHIHHARSIHGGYTYFVTDFIPGGDLDDFITSGKSGLQQGIEISKRLLSGVVELHLNALVHRDIKPENILLADDNRPVIADFGSVKHIPEGQIFVNGSRHAAIYRPPESYLDRYGFGSDLYQVGMVLYQLLEGYLNYNGVTYLSEAELRRYEREGDGVERTRLVDSKLRRLAEGHRLLQIDSLPAYVDRRVHQIIRKATHPDINRRYRSAAEFRLKLHELGPLPDWVVKGDGYILRNHRGFDYVITRIGENRYRCNRSRTGEANWRKVTGVDDDEKYSLTRRLQERLA